MQCRGNATTPSRVDKRAAACPARGQVDCVPTDNVRCHLVHATPAVAAEPFKRSETCLVGHAVGPLDPVAEINIGQTGPRRANDMVEDDVSPQALARIRTNIEEAVNHRQAVALLIAKAGPHQRARPPVDRRLPIFDHIGADRRLLDHVGKVALVHLGHATAWVTGGKIASQQMILLVGRPRLACADLQVSVATQQFPLGRVRLELGRQDSNRDARRAVNAARPVGDRLTAAEADSAQCFIEFSRVAAAELSENLPLDLAREIRARARVGHKEFGKAEWCAHPRPRSIVTHTFMLPVNAEEKSLDAHFSTDGAGIVPAGDKNQSSSARSTLNPAASSRATTSSIACGSRASHSTSIIVSLAGRLVKIRLWWISSTLTPAS